MAGFVRTAVPAPAAAGNTSLGAEAGRDRVAAAAAGIGIDVAGADPVAGWTGRDRNRALLRGQQPPPSA